MTLAKKSHKCKVCHEPYIKTQPMQKVCGWVCAVIEGGKVAKKTKASKERTETRKRKEALLTRSDWIKRAQVVFNEYIRARDMVAGHLCISSGKPLDWTGNKTDAGHYRSTGAAKHLRFNPDNCHAQSKHDNQFLAGNIVSYRIGLIERIGLERVEALEHDNREVKYTIEGLQAIVKQYRELTKQIKAQQ